ncbi:uncharacterized protein TRIADDRAFT_54948 [Trichoplax adhaerens]|uniref:Dynamin N-terminal domain-containing protein n=1 Tax=Trichoplax adhaerens TaxID=10228 RepID=B3RTF6_TRIAD|nr:predicted protein [Trichoplax adhaerens]EDV27216.1 predicted protein [Trichoplax adhaerens]|eukprot:XP_002111212.1 predicted protein [Trichoplax adhaerens]
MASTITQSQIEGINELKSGRIICKEYGVSIKGLRNLRDFRYRLDLFRKNQTVRNYKDSNSYKRIKNAIIKFEEIKIQLISILETANQLIFQKLEPEIANIVNANDEHRHYLQNIGKYISKLRDMEYPILVAGEVSAGKSSFINLILGESLLTASHLHSTTCICELYYSTDACIKPFAWNPVNKKLEQLEQITQIKDAHDMKSKIKEAMRSIGKKNFFTNIADDESADEDSDDTQLTTGKLEIYWNFNFLKAGIFVADSPGIGETSLANQQIEKYLPKACSIIYVINSANAGGIHTDRLVRLTSTMRNVEKEKFNKFSPESAIFICNKWDEVPDAEKSTVEKDTKDKLKTIWPGFRDSQLLFLSTEETQSHFEAGYISDDLVAVYSLISQLIEDSLKKITLIHSRYRAFFN